MSDEIITNEQQLPKPIGYKILCAVPKVSKEFASGIIKADKTIEIEQTTTVALFVVKLGPEAYKDTNKFPSGPWCKEGDFVVVRAYTGTRVKVNGEEFRIINDDQIEGTVDDPRGMMRAA